MNRRLDAIQRQFNRSAAGSYDNHAAVQRMMAERLSQSIDGWLSEGHLLWRDILEIGCGTGALTEILVNKWPDSTITALDIAPMMIKAAQHRILSDPAYRLDCCPVRFLQEDIELWAAAAPAASFDLIVSNACFQWLRDPQQTARQLRRLLRPGGLLVFTTFGPDTFCELHQAFDEVYRSSGMDSQRHGLSFQTINQWQSILEEAGFSTIRTERAVQTETYASARDFLLAVKAMGASTSEAHTSKGLSPRRLFASMYKEYEEKFSVPGGVAATFELLLIHASASKNNMLFP